MFRTSLRSVVAVAFALGLIPATTASAQSTAFVDVTVIPMDRERVVPNQTVVVRDGRIAAIGTVGAVRVPADAVRIDGTGKFLIPGIAEMHGHVFFTQTMPEEVALTFPELYVLSGVTLLRVMSGTPWQFQLREMIARGDLLGPTIYTASPSLNANSVNGADHAISLVKEHHAAGYDLLKIHPGLTRAEYEAVVTTAAELGIRVAGHVPEAVAVRRALEVRQGIDHLDGYYREAGTDDAVMAELAEITRRQGVYNAPTMDLWKTLLGGQAADVLRQRSELRYMPPALVEQWTRQVESRRGQATPQQRAQAEREIAARNRMLKALYDAGAKLILGSDSPQIFSVPGFSLVHELPAMVEAGVPEYGILEAATKNAAEYFDALDEFGTIEVGKRADLLLLDGNPLEDIGNVHRQAGVMVRGRWLDAEEIGRRLDAIATKNGG